jgi:hypothetical protein
VRPYSLARPYAVEHQIAHKRLVGLAHLGLVHGHALRDFHLAPGRNEELAHPHHRNIEQAGVHPPEAAIGKASAQERAIGGRAPVGELGDHGLCAGVFAARDFGGEELVENG